MNGVERLSEEQENHDDYQPRFRSLVDEEVSSRTATAGFGVLDSATELLGADHD